MRYLSPIALALTLALGGAAAFAADTTPANSTQATSHSQKACEKAADSKHLSGDARTKAIKDCREGKKE